MKVTLVKTEQVNYNVRTFWFEPEQSVQYTPGQFIELFLPHEDADDRGIKRWFTLSSSPTDKLLSISTKFEGDKASSFKKHLFDLKPGAELKMVEPMGDFVLPKDASIPLVFVAGGMGLTPFHSIVKWLSDTGEKRDIKILLAFNQPKDILFEDLFRSYVSDFEVIVSNPNENWKGEVGRISADKILTFIGESAEKYRIYISGPEPMVESLEKDMHAKGINKSQLVLDFFPGYTADLT